MQNSQILVSIVTIVYNGVMELERTIKSVLNQTYPNIEYIVIDGGSKDGSIDLIKKYNLKLAYWISEPDEGISDAFNKGIASAKGELIGMINCGDYYEPDAVEAMVNSYDRNQLSDNYFVFHGKIRMFNDHRSKVYAPFKLESFTYQMPIWHPTIFVNRKVYLDFKYDKTFKVAMDYELFSRVFKKGGEFIYLETLITNMNTAGLSNHNAIKGFKEVMIASKYNLKISFIKSYYYFIYRVLLNKALTVLKGNA